MYFSIKGHFEEFQFFPIMNCTTINTLVHALHMWYDLGTDYWKFSAWTKGHALLHLYKYCHLVYHWGSHSQHIT